MFFSIGILLGVLVLTPTLNYFGFTPIENLLTSLFGPNNSLVVIASLIIMILVIVIIYQANKGKE